MLNSSVLETHPRSKSQATKLYQKAFANLLIIHVKQLQMKGTEKKMVCLGTPGPDQSFVVL